MAHLLQVNQLWHRFLPCLERLGQSHASRPPSLRHVAAVVVGKLAGLKLQRRPSYLRLKGQRDISKSKFPYAVIPAQPWAVHPALTIASVSSRCWRSGRLDSHDLGYELWNSIGSDPGCGTSGSLSDQYCPSGDGEEVAETILSKLFSQGLLHKKDLQCTMIPVKEGVARLAGLSRKF
jgi:hypothetical protein